MQTLEETAKKVKLLLFHHLNESQSTGSISEGYVDYIIFE